MTIESPTRLISGLRGARYGEVLAVYARVRLPGPRSSAPRCSTTALRRSGRTLDVSVIAGELGAVAVKLNGPRHWMLDGLGQKVAVIEPVLRDFNGLTMRRIATVDLGRNPRHPPPRRNATWTAAPFLLRRRFSRSMSSSIPTAWPTSCRPTASASTPRVAPAGPEGSGRPPHPPPGLVLPDAGLLADELVVDTTATVATVIQDELENTYTLPD